MSAALTDKLTSTKNSTNPVVTTVASVRSISGTSLSCVSLGGWPTATKVHFITYQKTVAGAIDKTTQCDWEGIVSGTTIGSLSLDGGTDAGNAVGDFVEMEPTATWAQDLYSFGSKEHNTDGTHSNVTVGGTLGVTGVATFTAIPVLPAGAIALGYAVATSNQGSITIETDLTGLATTVTVPSGGRYVEVSVNVHIYSSVAGDTFTLSIKEGTTVLNALQGAFVKASTQQITVGSVILTPTAGAHTYKLSLTRTTGTGTASTYAAATYPAFILVKAL